MKYKIKTLGGFKITEKGLRFESDIYIFDCPYCDGGYYNYNVWSLFERAVIGHLRSKHDVYASMERGRVEIEYDQG